MGPVWVALAAIAGYELWAFLTGHPTWSDLISDSLRGHPVKQVVILTVVVLIAVHVIFGVFNRHKKHPPQKPPECCEVDY